MIEVIPDFLDRKLVSVANLAERFFDFSVLLVAFSVSKTADITVKLIIADALNSIAALVEAGVTVITVDNSIIWVVFGTEADFTICLENRFLLFVALLLKEKFILLHVFYCLL